MTRRIRALAAIVAAALALVSVGAADRAPFPSHTLGFPVDADEVGSDGAHLSGLLGSIAHPFQPATAPSAGSGAPAVSAPVAPDGDSRTTGFSPPPGSTPSATGQQQFLRLKPTVLPAADIQHSSVLLRTGAASSFATSLPPPSRA